MKLEARSRKNRGRASSCNRYLRFTGLTFSALIPVVAAIVAWILGHEELNLRQFIGIAISAAGVVLSQYTKAPDLKSGAGSDD